MLIEVLLELIFLLSVSLRFVVLLTPFWFLGVDIPDVGGLILLAFSFGPLPRETKSVLVVNLLGILHI